MLFCARSSLTHDRDDSLKKNIPAFIFRSSSRPPDASRHRLSPEHKTDYDICLPSTQSGFSCRKMQRRAGKGTKRRRRKRENVDSTLR